MDRPVSVNPKFNTARGAAIATASPPFDFQNVVLRVFPLRADIHALRLFCDRYLNIASEFELFEPAAPYVFLEVINYGKMSAVASNFGWVSQNEVAFAVLLNWYGVENGRRVFRGTASVCPFIFVDDESSVRGGREVFGWPKSLAWLSPGINAWARDPRSPRTLFTLSAMVFPELFAGQRQEPKVLFEIDEQAPASAAEFPPDPFNALNPMVSLPKAILNSAQMAGSLAGSFLRLPIQGFPLRGGSSGDRPQGIAGTDFRTASMPELLRDSFGNLNPFAQLPAFNTINLKQFRDSAKPEQVCYQALVNAKMTAKSVKRGGLLGQQGLVLGDPSGGYSLKIHRYDSWPIIESLGLDVASEATERGQRVSTLKPVLPNWMETDFHYGTGEVLCWRSCHTDWARPEPEKEASKKGRAPEKAPATPAEPEKSPEPRKPARFNTAEGGALDQVRGPFTFPDVTMRVMPLLADESKLQTFCDRYLNSQTVAFENVKGSKWKLKAPPPQAGHGLPCNMFRVWGRYVYLITTSFEEMSSELNVGWWAKRRVSFAFPVKWYRYSPENDGEWHLMSSALVTPYSYADSSVAVTTGREMQGRPVVKAEIESPPNSWLDEGGPVRSPELLRLTTGVYPALNANQRKEDRLLLEITGRDVLPAGSTDLWSQLASNWGERLAMELQRKKTDTSGLHSIQALALELLSGRRPINHLSLKQFRDAEDPDTACYQAVTLSPETLEHIYDLREIDERLHVAVHRYPSQPIVETLGLEVKWADAERSSVVEYLQPVRPFWLRAEVRAELSEDIFWRAGSSEWKQSHERWVAEPQTGPVGLNPKSGEGYEPKPDKAPLYFERVEPPPYAAATARWIESDPENKQRLQDLGGEAITAQVEGPRRQTKPGRWDFQTKWPRADAWRTIRQRRRSIERTGVTPQIAVETVLSREWLHFGNPRWLQRRAAREAEFDKLMTEASVRRRWQLLRWAQEWDLGSQDLDHELEKRHRGAPPKKKRFVIRQDTIANPKIRARFARDHHLDSLDDEYWFWTPDDVRGRRRLVRSQMRSVWWRELKDSWEGELKDLGNRLELTLESWKLSEGFRRFGDTLDFETRVTRLVDDVGKAQPRLRRLMSGARSGEHRRIYRQARKLVGELRSRAEETEAEIWQDIRLFESPPGAMSPEMFIEALDAKVDPWSQGTPAGDKKKKRSASKKKASKKKATRKKSTKKPTQSGTKKAAKTGKKGIELRPGMIQGLNQARITVLGGNQIFTVQDLLDSKNFHNLLQGAGPKAEMRMRNKAKKILEQAD